MMLRVGMPRAARIEPSGPDVAGTRAEGLRGVHVGDQTVDPTAAVRATVTDERSIRTVGLGDHQARVGNDAARVVKVFVTGLAGCAERDAHALKAQRGEMVQVGG